MDCHDLEAFLAVVQHGSFTRAANALHRSQPAVSRQIQRLEAELGIALLDRRSGAVRLTPGGERVRRFAQTTLAQLVDLRAAVTANDRSLTGLLSIAASTTPGQYLVPTIVAQFRDGHPGINTEVSVMDSASVAEHVQQGSADLGFIGMRRPHRQLYYTEIARDEVVLAVPPSHRFATRGIVSLAELSGERFIDREPGSGTRTSLIQALRQKALTLPSVRTVMVLSTTEAIVSAAEQGHGIGWVSSLALQHRDRQRVAMVRVQEVDVLRPMYLVHRRRKLLSPIAIAFVDSLPGDADNG